MAEAIALRKVTKRFSGVTILDDVNLDIPAGSVTVILGPSGSGKSTLLRCINHLEKLDGGTIRIGGQMVGYRQKGQALHELTAVPLHASGRKSAWCFSNSTCSRTVPCCRTSRMRRCG